jgi:CRISPR-associated endonuclease/helicase Cas3
VKSAVTAMAWALDNDLQEAMRKSAKFHDYGKVDVRYQAWLRNGDHMAARYALKPIAKSGKDILLRQQVVGLPKDFRHEILSLMFAERSPEVSGEIRDLVLHLVAAHHRRCRPFAPVVLDDGAECATYNSIAICKGERMENAPHRLDSGVSDRFWQLTAKYGWWGLSYLEALLRLADWQASEDEDAEVSL